MLYGPKPPGGRGNVIVLSEYRNRHFRLNRFFLSPSPYAVTVELAGALSADKRFLGAMKDFKAKDLADLGDLLIRLNEPIYLDVLDDLTSLRMYARFIEKGNATCVAGLISNEKESGPDGLIGTDPKLLADGKVFRASVRSVDAQMKYLTDARAYNTIIKLSGHEIDEVALAALDSMSGIKTLSVQRALDEISQGEISSRSLRAMHSLAAQGIDVSGILTEAGNKVVALLAKESANSLIQLDLLVVMRSLSVLKKIDDAYSIFRRLKTSHKQWLLMSMMEDQDMNVRNFARALRVFQGPW